MKISLRPVAKTKPVIITAILFFGSIIWRAISAASNVDFVLQKLGLQESAAKFLTTRGPDLAVTLTLGLLVFSLLFQVRRDEKKDEAEKPFYETPEYDLTPKEKPVAATKPKTEENQTVSPDGRIVASVTPEYLSNFFREHLYVQASRLVEPFIGKWIKVSGFVRDVTNHGSYSVVYLSTVPRTDEPKGLSEKVEHLTRRVTEVLISASTDKKELRDRFLMLRREQKITVLGKISQVESASLYLVECEIIEADKLS